jgi:hypothetical protein
MTLLAPLCSEGSPEVARFQRLARRSIRDARAWAEKLADHGVLNAHGTLEMLFRETLTLAAFLLTARCQERDLAMSNAVRQRLTAALRGEFECALDQIQRRDSSSKRPSRSTLERQLALYADGDHAALEITAELFARFCQVTGMHSTALAGTGPNLAHIFFYLRIFALVDAEERLTLEQRKRLLRAAQQCREHFAALAATTIPSDTSSPALPGFTEQAVPRTRHPQPGRLVRPPEPRRQ